jgi:hypothetical protein
MKGKGVMLVFVWLFIFGMVSTTSGDTLLFPVIVVNPPYVTTIVSVINQGPSTGYLRYDYDYKSASSDYSVGCFVNSFVRWDYEPDIVSFDASGTFDGGNALFNDPDFYNGSFKTIATPPARAYLLVSNSDSAGNRVNIGYSQALRGEAVVMDIASGSAWGYRAVNDYTHEDYTFLSDVDGGGLINVVDSGETFRFSFFDLNNWTTKFFVTPVGLNMATVDRQSTIRLYRVDGIPGINGRGGNVYSFNIPVTVKCTAAVNLTDLMDSTSKAALATTGGWGRLGIDSGDAAYIYKLEYTFSSPYVPFGASNNNGFQLIWD